MMDSATVMDIVCGVLLRLEEEIVVSLGAQAPEDEQARGAYLLAREDALAIVRAYRRELAKRG